MSIETEITRLQVAKANIKSAIEEKWGNPIPSSVKMTDYADYVSSAADAQYGSGLMAGGGGDVGNKCVVSSGSVVINSANILKNAGIASGMTLMVSNGGMASNAVVVQSANAYVLSGGRLVNPIVLYGGTATISSGGMASGGVVEGNYAGAEQGVMNVGGTASGTTIKARGLMNVSGNVPAVSVETYGQVKVFDGATVGVVSMNTGSVYCSNASSLTVNAIMGSGYVDFRSSTGNGVVVSSVDIASGSVFPGDAHFGAITLRSNASMNYFGSSGLIDSLVMAGNVLSPSSSYGTIGFVSTMGSGTGLGNFQGTIGSAILDKGYVAILSGGRASNVEILGSGMLNVGTSATANGVIVSSCASYSYGGGMFIFDHGLKVDGSNAIASNVTVLQNGSMYVASGGRVDEPVVSSGANVYFMSGSATYIESKTGAGVYVLVSSNHEVASSAITDDYFENGCNITFACPPKVTVKYAGAGTGYEVAGNGTYYDGSQKSVNGRYFMYNGNTSVYKHETEELYLVHSNGYYMLASTPVITSYYGSYFYNATGFTSSYNAMGGSGSISVSSFSVQPIGAWSIDDGATWNEYGSTIATGDAKGSLLQRTITFSNVDGYIAPSPITATMYDRNNVFEVKYTMEAL
jgi:autotransporter passenger strand-loop-strand repeat protein